MVNFDTSQEAVRGRYYAYVSHYGDDHEFQLMTVMAEDMLHKLKEEMEHYEQLGGEFKHRADGIREIIEPLLEAGGRDYP